MVPAATLIDRQKRNEWRRRSRIRVFPEHIRYRAGDDQMLGERVLGVDVERDIEARAVGEQRTIRHPVTGLIDTLDSYRDGSRAHRRDPGLGMRWSGVRG